MHVHGCFYHLSQNLYRKVQASGLQQLYTEDQQVASAVRMMAALAFVPVNHVVRCFETLQDDLPTPDVLQPVVDYMEDNCIGRPQRRGRRAPKFPLALWNVHEQVVQDVPRTNNAAEGFHRHMQASIQAFHPNIWTFLRLLKKEQSLYDVHITQIMAGQPPPPQR